MHASHDRDTFHHYVNVQEQIVIHSGFSTERQGMGQNVRGAARCSTNQLTNDNLFV
jgi:hypothetical protein